jgi:hypothetical protein
LLRISTLLVFVLTIAVPRVSAQVVLGGTIGVFGESSSYSGEGVKGHGTGTLTDGVVGTSDQSTGVYGYAIAQGGSAIGVWGKTNATWGFYTEQNMYVGGNCTGCSVAFIAQSEEDDLLDVGEVVSVN